MAFKQITAPSVTAVTLAQTKAHLRIDSTAEDEFLTGLITSAVDFLEAEAGLSLIKQEWRLWYDCLTDDGVIHFPRHPVQRMTQVTWYNAEGLPIILPGSAYFLNTMTRPARLRFDRAECPAGTCNGIEIDFESGYGDTGTDVPDMIKRALLVLIAHWYEFRGVYAPVDQPVSVPELYSRLIRHYRPVRLA